MPSLQSSSRRWLIAKEKRPNRKISAGCGSPALRTKRTLARYGVGSSIDYAGCGPAHADASSRGRNMKYRKLGNTGLIVSEVALGTMQFGSNMNMGNLGQEETTRMVKQAIDRGINFIDTADVYSLGESETLLGNALKGVREEIVLATKVRLPMGGNFNHSGATR